MTVPSTETALDRMAEAKRISEEVTRLTGIREIAERDTRTSLDAAEHATTRVRDLESRMAVLTEAVEQGTGDVLAFLAHCEQVMRSVSEGMGVTLLLCATITDKVKAADLKLKAVEQRAAEVHEATVRETEAIGIKRRDLNIYHERLKKQFEEHMPGQKLSII